MTGNRGSTDLIGYALLVTIVIASVGMAAGVGVDVTSSTPDHLKETNRITAQMTALGERMERVLSDRRIASLGWDSRSHPSILHSSLTIGGVDATGPIHLSYDGFFVKDGHRQWRTLGAGLVTSEIDTATLRRPPSIVCRGGWILIDGLTIAETAPVPGSVESGTTVELQRIDRKRRVSRAVTSTRNVSVTINGSHSSPALVAAIASRTSWEVTGSNELTCRNVTEGIAIFHTTIAVSWSQ